MSESLIEQELNSPVVRAMPGMGGPANPLDDRFKESINLAKVLMKKMKMKPEQMDT